ncbi:hypothetical protein [Nocardia mangyaensis]|uniref:hypothetical protein n=1 Tax=Nocardia mangyaensis TaxID=2213200 RepID=UPI002674E596|nr:hypothetical protein [Nocardia mangyaensis]MDO3648983.1 hypothetical protein [Nocardia mangyaensis]
MPGPLVLIGAAAAVGGVYAGLSSYANGSKPDRSTDESPDATIARNRLTDLQSSFDGTYQEPKVSEGSYKEPSNMSDLYERVEAMSMSEIATLHTRWETLRNKLDEGFKTYDAEIARAIEDNWSGDAAESAGKGIQEYVEKSGNLLGSAQMMAEKVKLVQSAMQITKDRVKPHEGSTISGIASYIPGPTWKMDSHNADTAKAEGAEVVKGVYYTAIQQADTKVPLVPQPYNPVDPGATKPGGNDGDPTQTRLTTQQPTTQQPGTEQPTTQQPSTEDPAAGNEYGDDNPTTPAATTPQATTPQTTTPTTPTTPNATMPAATTPSGLGGSPGSGLGTGGSGSGVPGAGQSLPGTGAGTGATGVGAGAAGAGGAGRAGMAGMGGMGAGAGRGKGEDDKEVGSKDYLVNQQNGEELTGLGEDQRVKTVPPVIGE